MPPASNNSRQPPELQALLETLPHVGRDLYDDHARGASAPDTPNVEAAVTEMLRAIQGQVGELSRSRESLAMSLRDAESQLAKANADAASLRAERDHLIRLKALYERKFASIRDLAQQ